MHIKKFKPKRKIMKLFESLTKTQRGIIYIVVGILILLDALNLLDKTIHYVILVSALSLIVYGTILTDLAATIFKKIKKC